MILKKYLCLRITPILNKKFRGQVTPLRGELSPLQNFGGCAYCLQIVERIDRITTALQLMKRLIQINLNVPKCVEIKWRLRILQLSTLRTEPFQKSLTPRCSAAGGDLEV
jgi:hypothetical protein